MKSLFNPSWRTSAFGVVAFVICFFIEVKNELDDDPKTYFNIPRVLSEASLMMGLLNARDSRVSSEQAKA